MRIQEETQWVLGAPITYNRGLQGRDQKMQMYKWAFFERVNRKSLKAFKLQSDTIRFKFTAAVQKGSGSNQLKVCVCVGGNWPFFKLGF